MFLRVLLPAHPCWPLNSCRDTRAFVSLTDVIRWIVVRKEMLKASSSSPTVDTDKPGEDQTTAETDEHQTRDDVDNELSFEEE